MHCPPQYEVGAYIPFKIIHLITLPTPLFDEIRMIVQLVEDGEPVAGWCFRVGSVCPEFGNDTSVIGAFNDIGRIRFARVWVDGVALARCISTLRTVESA